MKLSKLMNFFQEIILEVHLMYPKLIFKLLKANKLIYQPTNEQEKLE